MATLQFVLLFVISLPFLCFALQTDILLFNSVIKDPETLVSNNQQFKLGFFTPANTTSTNRYLGVLFKGAVVWVANRDEPLRDSSSTVTISKDGNLVLINSRNQTVWSTNVTTSATPLNTTLQLLDTGNLLLWDITTGITTWESFSQPTDVMLPKMKISHNIKTGKKVIVSAWKNGTDPGVGSFTFGLSVSSIRQCFIWNNGRPHFRSGPWNGRIFVGVRELLYRHIDGFGDVKKDDVDTFNFVQNREKAIVVLEPWGVYMVKLWYDQKQNWDDIWYNPQYECDLYAKCGQFGSCNNKASPTCSCFRGFEPVNKQEWESGNWTSGCHRATQLKCDAGGSSDVFLRVPFMKVPDFPQAFSAYGMDECRRRCSSNCSCVAYAHEPNIGCMLWTDTLIDAQNFIDVGVDLYIRLASSELDTHKDKKLIIIIPVVTTSVGIIIFIFIIRYWTVKRTVVD